MRVFYWREKIRKSEYFSLFLGAYKIPRGFLARVFQNFGNKKASKMAAREKNPYGWGFYLRHFVCMSCLSLALFMLDFLLMKFCISLSLSVSYGVFTDEFFSLFP